MPLRRSGCGMRRHRCRLHRRRRRPPGRRRGWWRCAGFHQSIRRRRRRRRSSAHAAARRRRQRRQCRRSGAGMDCRPGRSAGWWCVTHGVRQRNALRSAARRCSSTKSSGPWWRHHHGAWRPDKNGNGWGGRRRQTEAFMHRRWRRQHREFPRPRRQEKQRRPRRRRIARADEHQHRLVDEGELRGRWRRHAEIIIRRMPAAARAPAASIFQAPPRIPDVRAVRVAAHIGPVGLRRIGDHAAAPDDLLAADRQHAADAARNMDRPDRWRGIARSRRWCRDRAPQA